MWPPLPQELSIPYAPTNTSNHSLPLHSLQWCQMNIALASLIEKKTSRILGTLGGISIQLTLLNLTWHQIGKSYGWYDRRTTELLPQLTLPCHMAATREIISRYRNSLMSKSIWLINQLWTIVVRQNISIHNYTDGLVWYCSISSANALEML